MLLYDIVVVLIDEVLLAKEDIRWIKLQLSAEAFNYLILSRLLLIMVIDNDDVVLLIGRICTFTRCCLIWTVCSLSLNQHIIPLLKRHLAAILLIVISYVLSLIERRRSRGHLLLC